jgi:hypothetical protein
MTIEDTFMMFIVISGFALCGAYFRAQYMDWRNEQTAEVERTIRVRLLWRDQLSRPRENVVRAVGDLAGRRVSRLSGVRYRTVTLRRLVSGQFAGAPALKCIESGDSLMMLIDRVDPISEPHLFFFTKK